MQQVGINSALIAILAVPLSACGGAVNSAPVPTPAPAAFPLTASQSFQTITGTTTYTGQFSSDPIAAPSTATLQSINVNGRGDQPTISYNAGSDSYTLQSGMYDLRGPRLGRRRTPATPGCCAPTGDWP